MNKSELLLKQLKRDGLINSDGAVNHNLTQVPAAWQPAPELVEYLKRVGYCDQAIKLYRDLFVYWCRSEKARLTDPDSLFKRYCLSRYKKVSIAKPMMTEWLPSLSTINRLVANNDISLDTVTQAMAKFVWGATGRTSVDWDGEFYSWVLKHYCT